MYLNSITLNNSVSWYCYIVIMQILYIMMIKKQWQYNDTKLSLKVTESKY